MLWVTRCGKPMFGKKLRFKSGVSEREDFGPSYFLKNKLRLYDDYRNYVEGKNLLTKDAQQIKECYIPVFTKLFYK